VRPQIRAGPKPGHLISTTCVKDDPGTLWGHVSVRPKPSLRACGARPSRGGQSKLGWPSGQRPEMPGRFSPRDALCASVWCGPTNGKTLRCHRCFYDKAVAKTGAMLGLA
jgi:hypothetical protein